MCFLFYSEAGSRVQVSVIVPCESRCYRYPVPSARSALPFSTPGWAMESALGDETGGPTPDRLQESSISDLAEDSLNLRPTDELETIPVEETQDLKPEDLQESAPAETTQDTKPGTGQVLHMPAVGLDAVHKVLHHPLTDLVAQEVIIHEDVPHGLSFQEL